MPGRWRAAVLAALGALAGVVAQAQDFTTLKGHGGPVTAIAVSPSGQVLTASFDNSLGLWQGRVPRWLEGHDAAVTAAIFTRDGVPVSGSDDFTVRIWGEAPRILGSHRGKVTALAASPDGRYVASAGWDRTIRLWPLVAGAEPLQLAAPGAGVNALAFDAAGRLFAGTLDGRVIRYDDVSASPVPLARHGFGINELVAGPGWIAYGAVDGGTRVIDPETGALIADFTLERRPILALAWHRGTDQLAVGDGQGYIMIIDTARWRIARDFRATRRGPVWALAFSTDGKVIYAGGLDDVAYAWPVALLDRFDPANAIRSTVPRAEAEMPNGQRQFVRRCSICHALDAGPSRKAGPSLHGLFGRRAGTLAGYPYSPTLKGSDIVWNEATVDALFGEGPDRFIPGSKMPTQVIAAPEDRADLIAYLRRATSE